MAGSSLEAHEAALNAMEYLQSGARRMRHLVIDAMRETAGKLNAYIAGSRQILRRHIRYAIVYCYPKRSGFWSSMIVTTAI